MNKGRIFEIREFTLHDGPGVRTTVFFKGCPLRCAWCHNPEGQSFEIETMRSTTSVGAAASVESRVSRDRIVGQDWTAAALAEELLKNADLMMQSGGGVTFSGGEPLAQAAFLLELIPLLREKGVHLVLETSGYVSCETYRKIVSQLDFVYQDIKLLDADSFRRWTGGELDVVLENVSWLRRSGVPFVFRVPCIPDVDDDAASRAAFDEFADGAKIEYLPYNTAAGAKYPMLGRKMPYCNAPAT